MLERYLMLGGWNVLTIYDSLAKTPAGLAYARAIYAEARPRYSDGVRFYVDMTLQWDAARTRNAA